MIAGIEKLVGLHPVFRAQVRGLLEVCGIEGLPVGLFSGLRTWEEQAEIYAQGRTKPGAVVTKAKAGWTWHNYGLASDIVFYPWSWCKSNNWVKLARMGRMLGLRAGADWGDFPHFENSFGMSITQAYELYRKGGLAAVWGVIRL